MVSRPESVGLLNASSFLDRHTDSIYHSGLPPIRACLFDMDGLLINSEDLYSRCLNDVLHEYDKPSVPWSIKAHLQGRPFVEAGRIFLEWAQLPCDEEEFFTKIRALQAKYFGSTQPLPGALELLKDLSNTRTPHIHIALATSSNVRNFRLKTAHLDHLIGHFPKENRILGDDERILPGRGKPAPDIYLLALKTLNDAIRREGTEDEITPEECLVLEDAVPGVEAGRRAGMQVVWCPHQGLLKEYVGREKEVLAGLTGAYKDVIPPKVETAGQRVVGAPGKIDDGWAVLLDSLENFPYVRFGLQI